MVPPYIDYFKKSLSEPEITEDIISDRLHFLTTNDKLKNKPKNGKDSYFTVYERKDLYNIKMHLILLLN